MPYDLLSPSYIQACTYTRMAGCVPAGVPRGVAEKAPGHKVRGMQCNQGEVPSDYV